MKAIVNGKRYDTETAQELANYWNGLGDSDFRNLSEALYKTKSGAFFLAGSGGAMTKYAEHNGNTSWGSSRLEPLTSEEAYQWLEDHGECDVIEREFADRVCDA